MKKLINYIRLNFNYYHFIILWTILNIVQVGITELTSDEGYYWFYSSRLEWGYYDHPPFLALLIKAGTEIFKGELGVRFFNVLLMSFSLIFLFKIRQWSKREKNLIYIILLSIPLFNYITIIAFPDTPLVAFSIISLYLYKRFLDKSDIKTALLWGLTMALMLYSKYHAVIFILFILLSNLKLLKNKYFYLAVLLASILFIPHLLWQYRNGFPSFGYHLYGRATGFEFSDLLEYISQQIPIIGIGIIFIPFIYKPEDQFEKILKFISVGTFIFFLLNTLRGFVHLHWTSIVLFPVIILSARFYSRRQNNRLFNYLMLPFLIVIIIARIYLVLPLTRFNSLHVDYYHGRKLWAEDIETIAGKCPVVFEIGNGSLREAPLYSFYSGNMGIALFTGERKKSQYQVWNYEDSIQYDKVMFIKSGNMEGFKELKTRMGKSIQYKMIDNFISFNNIKIIFKTNEILTDKDTLIIPLGIINHRESGICFTSQHSIYLLVNNKIGEELRYVHPFNDTTAVLAHDTLDLRFRISLEKIPAGNYHVIAGINDGITYPSFNSKKYSILIKDY